MLGQDVAAAARLFHDASDFDDRIASVDDIVRMEALLPAATAELRSALEGSGGAPPSEAAELPSAMLEQALRVSYLEVARAALILRNFARFRREQGWPFRLDAHSCDVALRSRVHAILPQPDSHGRAVVVFNAGRLDPRVCEVKEFHRMASYVLEQLTADPAVQHRGVCILFDLRGADVAMARHFSRADVRRGIAMWRDCFPCKVKLLTVVNASPFVHAVFRTGLSLVHPRVRARVQLVPDAAALRGAIAPCALPAELGGELDSEARWNEWIDERQRLEREAAEAPLAHALGGRAPVPPARAHDGGARARARAAAAVEPSAKAVMRSGEKPAALCVPRWQMCLMLRR
ncbi:hypothetical protein KFE25_011784 [Diacronema lutheri]|uniref:CRAL-TRIO domain-containing protein n=1 Tax=Diacronema lutheri TaxID=2081491 RepID=A0A8J5X683_DIALT|nr:hypothetical protein KFE25_011784 [Diacronema lutheri]